MKKAILLCICFMMLVIIGTIAHEIGHIIPAKYLGYETTLHYGSMHWKSTFLDYSNSLYHKYGDIDKVPSSELDMYNKLKQKHEKDTLKISLGGPLQTMGTGMLGLVFLFFRRKRLKEIPFGLVNWIAVFLALFWSRQIFNLLSGLASYSLYNRSQMFGGDEAKISKLLDLPIGFIGLITAILGIGTCSIVVLNIVPKYDRNKFIITGIMGSGIGYFFWFKVLGPLVLPY